jgi:hypothetical protein
MDVQSCEGGCYLLPLPQPTVMSRSVDTFKAAVSSIKTCKLFYPAAIIMYNL